MSEGAPTLPAGMVTTPVEVKPPELMTPVVDIVPDPITIEVVPFKVKLYPLLMTTGPSKVDVPVKVPPPLAKPTTVTPVNVTVEPDVNVVLTPVRPTVKAVAVAVPILNTPDESIDDIRSTS